MDTISSVFFFFKIELQQEVWNKEQIIELIVFCQSFARNETR